MSRFHLLIFILILVGGLVWLTKVQPVFATSNAAPLLSLPLQNATASAIASETSQVPPFNGDGVVTIDMSAGAPGAPYIVYETPQGGFGMKSLIFNVPSDDPCQVSAGELPCARNVENQDSAESDASPIPAGTPIHLVGEVEDQAVIVESYQTLANAPSGMQYLSIPLTTTGTLPDGTSLTPLSVMDNASCTLGIGCFGNGVDRLAVTVTTGKTSRDTEMVPGTISLYGSYAIILLSVTQTGSGQVAHFVAVAR